MLLKREVRGTVHLQSRTVVFFLVETLCLARHLDRSQVPDEDAFTLYNLSLEL